jgi:hypothetical protein
LNKRHKPQGMPMRRYRTQEVAGSSPASSIETPARQGFSSVRAARFVGPSTGLYRFAQSLPHCIGEWELGERLRGAHACDEKVAESVHRELMSLWFAAIADTEAPEEAERTA